jgi:hypothetical protein
MNAPSGRRHPSDVTANAETLGLLKFVTYRYLPSGVIMQASGLCSLTFSGRTGNFTSSPRWLISKNEMLSDPKLAT